MDEQLTASQIDRTENIADSARDSIRRESEIANRFWGGVEWRIIMTFLLFAIAWTGVVVLGIRGRVSLWAAFPLQVALASTFYMPMHESVHGNISGRVMHMRWLNELVGKLASVPLLMGHAAHRASHMKHHAFTNEPGRDPDYISRGRITEIPGKWLGMTLLNSFLPLFAFVPAARRLLPKAFRQAMAAAAGVSRPGRDAKQMFRQWLLIHAVLGACFAAGFGVPALVLWYLPGRVQMMWLVTVFAWYPHHPADRIGRYVDTRIARFPGSGLLIRGHDHHAIHHLYPRVAHYRLRRVWSELADDLVAKGVRSQGSAKAATGPVVWS